MNEEVIAIEYEFKLKDGREKKFSVRLKKPMLQFVAEQTSTVRQWTKLTHHQCPNCPLKPETHPHCPIAANLVTVIDSFKDTVSVEEADITVEHESRVYSRYAAVQYGISSLMGIY